MVKGVSQDVFTDKATILLSQNKISVSKESLMQLYIYYSLAVSWGSKMNITANLNEGDYLCENFLDPVVGLSVLNQAVPLKSGIIDFGAGGGFVGITARILFPGLGGCILVDSVRKKVSFMQMVLRELGFADSQAVHSRAEEFSTAKPHQAIVSRATWNWDEFLSVASRFKDENTILVSFEGPKAHASQTNPPQNTLKYTLEPFQKERYLYIV